MDQQKKITIESYKAIIQYVEVFLITERKADSIYKVKSLGFASAQDPRFFNNPNYTLASLPSSVLKEPFVTLTLI